MARASRFALLAAAALGALAARAEGGSFLQNSPKLILRTSGGFFRNTGGEQSLTATSFGGFNVGFNYYLTPRLAAGLAYKADFDLARATLPFKGFDVSGRWYPFGQGTYTVRRLGDSVLEYHPVRAYYISAAFSERTYFLAPSSGATTDTEAVKEGGFAAVNIGLGIDIRASRHFEYNVEVTQTAMSFASTDSTVKISSTLLYFGMNYVW